MSGLYRFIEDPGHGWLEVPSAELKALGIEHLISGCSYQRNGLTYLEEDCDLSVFATAKGWTPKDAYTHWQTTYQENTFVRRLPPYPASANYTYKASCEYRYGRQP